MDEDYNSAWNEYRNDPDAYWTKIAEKLYWHKRWDKLYEMSKQHPIRWFVGGKLSVSYNCLDKPIEEGFGDKVIAIHESDLTKQSYNLTYKQIFDQVVKLAGVLHDYGLQENDHVLVNLPLIPESIISFLAINRLGGVYLSAAEGHTENSLSDTIDEFRPKIIITTNMGVINGNRLSVKRILDSALATSKHQPACCIVLQRHVQGREPAQLNAPRDISWDKAIAKCQPFLSCIPADACQPLFYIYTSGTSGKAKLIVHAVGSFTVGLLKGDMMSWGCYNGEPYFTSGLFAWISAHCGISTGPMLVKTPTIIYEAEPLVPHDLRRLYSLWAKHGVNYVFMAISQQRKIIKQDPEGRIAKSCGPYKLKGFICAGSIFDEQTIQYFKNTFGVPAIAIYGQTELGSPVTTSKLDSNGDKTMDQPELSSGLIMPGMNVKILKDDMTETAVRETGRIAIKLPGAPGVLIDIHNNSEYCREKLYGTYQGYYDTKDEGYVDENGYLYITNRYDDVYKVGGARISCENIETVALQNSDIEEIAVVLDVIKDKTGGIEDYIPVGFYITKKDCKKPNKQIESEIIELVHTQLCQNIAFGQLYRVASLPVVPVSSKVARGTIRHLVRNYQDLKGPPEATNKDVVHIWEILKNGH